MFSRNVYVAQLPEFAQVAIKIYVERACKLTRVCPYLTVQGALDSRVSDLNGLIDSRVIDRCLGLLNTLS